MIHSLQSQFHHSCKSFLMSWFVVNQVWVCTCRLWYYTIYHSVCFMCSCWYNWCNLSINNNILQFVNHNGFNSNCTTLLLNNKISMNSVLYIYAKIPSYESYTTTIDNTILFSMIFQQFLISRIVDKSFIIVIIIITISI